MLKLALPAGDLRRPLAGLLEEAGLTVAGYGDGSRAYRLRLRGQDDALVRVFREKDIPIQIALGNYDLGVCPLSWVSEFLARYPREAIVKMRDLGIGTSRLYVAAAEGRFRSLAEAAGWRGLRLASEYANLAEAFAMAARLPAYRVVPVSGATEAYPPEDADLALVTARDKRALRRHGLKPLHHLLDSSAWVIANRDSLRSKDLGPVLRPLLAKASPADDEARLRLPAPVPAGSARPLEGDFSDKVRLAIPDGHQQEPTAEALTAADLEFQGYDSSGEVRRPQSSLTGLEAKVIRPQDMPQLVASGSYDLAITGRDCLRDHLYRFPSSPVKEVVDLGRGQFDICAVVSCDLQADSVALALEQWRRRGKTVLRVASEFVNIADHYARTRRLGRYRIIPIAGASEGFVPEDADLLIEGTATGRTLVENDLKSIDLLFRSTLCLIAGKGRRPKGRKAEVLRQVISRLKDGARAAA